MSKQFMKTLAGGAVWIYGELDALLHYRYVVLDMRERIVEVMQQALPFPILR
jgi:hypothetical protein